MQTPSYDYFYDFQLRNICKINRPSVPGDIWFVAQQIAHFKKVPVCKVLESNRQNVSELYGIPIWSPSNLPPLKVLKNEYAHACNRAILVEEDANDVSNWIHTCAGKIRVTRK